MGSTQKKPINHIHTQSQKKNMYHRQNIHQRSRVNQFQRRNNQRNSDFQEDQQCAFFLGKLNKHLDRDTIYNQLIKLAKQYDFYVKKLGMPYGDSLTQRGNKGYAFVHTRTSAEARKMIDMGSIRINNQWCEIKAYGGRGDGATSPCRATHYDDSGTESGITTPRKPRNTEKQLDDLKQVKSILLKQSSRARTSNSDSISESLSEEAEPVVETINSAETIVEQTVPTNDHVFLSYDKATAMVLKKHNEAINSGMTSEQFINNFTIYYENSMYDLANSTDSQIADLKYGLVQYLENTA